MKTILNTVVLTRSGFVLNPRTRIGGWLLNSGNRLIRKYIVGGGGSSAG